MRTPEPCLLPHPPPGLYPSGWGVTGLPGGGAAVLHISLPESVRLPPPSRSWVGYEKEGFRGHQYLLEEGEYTDWTHWGGYDEVLTSLRVIRTVSKGNWGIPLPLAVARLPPSTIG